MAAGLAFCVKQIQRKSFFGEPVKSRSIESSREEAKRKGSMFFTKEACHFCGGTVFYTSNGGCRACHNLKQQERDQRRAIAPQHKQMLSPHVVAQIKKQAEADGLDHYFGNPCHKCAGTQRKLSDSTCYTCKKIRTRRKKDEAKNAK